MKNKKNIRKRCLLWLWIVLGFSGLLLAGLAVLLYLTTHGARLVTSWSLEHYLEDQDVGFTTLTGSLQDNVVYTDVVLKHLPYLPAGTVLTIKKLKFALSGLTADDLFCLIEGGRLQLPTSDPLFFNGRLEDGRLDFNFYSRYIHLADFAEFALLQPYLCRVRGDFNKLDVYVSGEMSEPYLTGKVRIDKLSTDIVTLQDSRVAVNLGFQKLGTEDVQVNGTVKVEGGVIKGAKTAEVFLKASTLTFKGPAQDPELSVRAEAKVQGVEIGIAINGTLKEPELTVVSTPPLPQDQLLVMLATDKKWIGAPEDIVSGSPQVQSQIARDFIDYFILGNAGERLGKSLGIKDVFFVYGENSLGAGVTKSLSGNLDAMYSVEQTKGQSGSDQTTQKIGGELKLNESVAIGAEREFLYNATTDSTQNPQQNSSDTFYMKYKTKF